MLPPSVDMSMFTLAQLTGAAVVLFTVQVMVCVDNPGHDTAVFGAETPNGPEVLVTVTVISVNWVCPTVTGGVELYGALSLTVSLKFRVLDTELSASMLAAASPPAITGVTNNPASMVDNFGKMREGLVVGLKVNQFGPVVFVGLATLFAPDVLALSFCSQQ